MGKQVTAKSYSVVSAILSSNICHGGENDPPQTIDCAVEIAQFYRKFFHREVELVIVEVWDVRAVSH